MGEMNGERIYLKRCVELAAEAVNAGDEAFGSVLVSTAGEIVAEARNRVNEKNSLAHPEYELAAWALENISREERQRSTMYTSGEHCPMCAGAQGWAEIGGLVYLSSAAQLAQWQKNAGRPAAPLHFVPAAEILKNTEVRAAPLEDLLEEIEKLHKLSWEKIRL